MIPWGVRIPPEVFDKRAVERGQVRFQDVAFIEVTPRFDQKNPLTLAVELTDFSVYHSQGLADAIAADLKEGKSEVVCDTGALIKISKSKEGVITRDVGCPFAYARRVTPGPSANLTLGRRPA